MEELGNDGQLIGDFNNILINDKKMGGNEKSDWSFRNFSNFISDIRLLDLNFVGHPYTWWNRRDGDECILERLDRGLISHRWRVQCPDAILYHLHPIGLNHCPTMMETNQHQKKKKSMFYYDLRWGKPAECKEMVERAWNTNTNGIQWYKVQQRVKIAESD